MKQYEAVVNQEVQSRVLPYLAIFAAVVFWGLSFVASKIALETIPILTLIFIRFGLAALLFTAIWTRTGFPRLCKKDWIKISLLSFFEPGLYFLFETTGLSMTSAPKVSLIIATIPVFVLILAVIFLKEKASMLNFAGVAVSLVGIGILVGGERQIHWAFSGEMMGDILIFGAVIAATIYIIMARDLGLTHSALTITGLQSVFATILYLPAFIWEYPKVQWQALTTGSLWALVYLVIFATCAAFFCWNYSLTKIRASSASVFLNGIPVVTAIAAWVLLKESLTPVQMGGGGLVLMGVYLANLRR
ncbi:MAG: EamA family transporter [Desulfatibacillum sp.]|nr:EamA family transporter [Desulfatibacillum sp.]